LHCQIKFGYANVDEFNKLFINFEEFLRFFKMKASISNYELIGGKDVRLIDLLGIAKLDRKFYPSSFRASLNSLFWTFKNPEIYDIVYDETRKKAIAYTSVMPLNDCAFEKIMSGDFIDTNLKYSEIGAIGQNGSFHLYISSFIIDVPYRNDNFIKLFLLKSFKNKLKSWIDKGMIFEDCFADVASAEGMTLAQHFKMSKVKDTSHGTMLYLGPDPKSVF